MAGQLKRELLPEELAEDEYLSVRSTSVKLCEPLSIEDCLLQCHPDASPPKWHLAHTTWFFEELVLKTFSKNYKVFSEFFHHLFNSYYESLGNLYFRPHRGNLSRPSLDEVKSYRAYIDECVLNLMQESSDPKVLGRIRLGLEHERQHQELLLMDTKYNLYQNPSGAHYLQEPIEDKISSTVENERSWFSYGGGMILIGAPQGFYSFCYDNETPCHPAHIPAFELSKSLVTNAEFLEFIEDGGYEEPKWWLSDGWEDRKSNPKKMPYYWHYRDSEIWEYQLRGSSKLQPDRPVSHITFYEADAFARWAGCRLPTEFELEYAASKSFQPRKPNFLETGLYQARPALRSDSPSQLSGDLWEWTSSDYAAYPGYRPWMGSLGEYNGKFMCNQKVLRGGSCVTPEKHYRISYRNFFYPNKFWPFTGFRLAKDLS